MAVTVGWRWGILGLGIVFITGSSSTIWAWQRLKVVLIDSGAVSGVCSSKEVSKGHVVEDDVGGGAYPTGGAEEDGYDKALCSSQDRILTFAWRIGCIVPMIASFPFGIIFDKVGPRWTGVMGQLQFMIGFILFGVGGPDFVYYIAFCLIGLAQIPIAQSLISVCNLFPAHANLVLAVISSACDCSYNVPWILLGLQQLFLKVSPSLSIKNASRLVFIVYGCMFSGSQILVALLVFPDEPFTEAGANISVRTDNMGSNRKRALMIVDLDISHTSSSRTGVDGVARKSSRSKGKYEPPTETMMDVPLSEGALSQSTSLHDQVKSKLYFAEVVYFFVSFLHFLYYNGAVSKIIGQYTTTKEQQALYLRAFGIVQGMSFVMSLTFGYTVDRLQLPLALVIHNTFALVSLLGDAIVPTLWMQPICFVSFQFFASFIYTQAYAWMRIAFGFDNVNTLMGLNCAVVGTVTLLLQGISGLTRNWKWSSSAERSVAGWVLIIVRPFLFLVPLFLLWRMNNPHPVQSDRGSSSKQPSSRRGYSVAASEFTAELGRMHSVMPAFKYGEESLKIATWSRNKISYEHEPLDTYSDSDTDDRSAYRDDARYDYELTTQL